MGSRSFLVLIFAFPIRVGERQRPFNHSCAASGKLVSLELKYFSGGTPQEFNGPF
jgi:hypothetical protein